MPAMRRAKAIRKALRKSSAAACDNGHIIVIMDSGVEILFPTAGHPRLSTGIPGQLNRIETSPFGLHWPDLDEDLSLRGLLAGDYGQISR